MTAATRIALAAGGTGGHMFPAEALASELVGRGCQVDLITDVRGGGFSDRMSGIVVHRISAGGLAGGGLGRRARGLLQLVVGFFQARTLLARLTPGVVVGFGGYASVPTVLAASLTRIPTVLHEQNAILGRANRLLARRATRIAASFDRLETPVPADRIAVTGNPVRPAIAAVGDRPAAAIDGPINILVTGGSQGARVFGRVVPAAIGLLPAAQRQRIRLSQQCRAEDIEAVRQACGEMSLTADLATFFTDMPARLAAAHLVICRSGASTVAELAVAGRPAILVPYPSAADDHQTANARAVAAAGGAWVMPEPSFTAEALAARLQPLIDAPARLTDAATAMRRAGRRDAAAKLAELVLALLPTSRTREAAA